MDDDFQRRIDDCSSHIARAHELTETSVLTLAVAKEQLEASARFLQSRPRPIGRFLEVIKPDDGAVQPPRDRYLRGT